MTINSGLILLQSATHRRIPSVELSLRRSWPVLRMCRSKYCLATSIPMQFLIMSFLAMRAHRDTMAHATVRTIEIGRLSDHAEHGFITRGQDDLGCRRPRTGWGHERHPSP